MDNEEKSSTETPPAPKITLDEQQIEAVEKCCDLSVRFWPVTGPAGTGKTTILRTVYDRLKEKDITAVLCAPTGKAAKRIQEATGIPAMTIHRLLEYTHPGERDPKTGKFYGTSFPRRDKNNPVDYQVILCDEYAMVGHQLHRELIDAVPTGGVIRAFGDVQQLQPIEKYEVYKNQPSPFQHALKKFKGTTLKVIHRQGEGSGIVVNAKGILDKRIPVRRPDFEMIITDSTVSKLEEYVIECLEKGIDFSKTENQIIVPRATKILTGAAELNVMLQRIFKPHARTEGYRVDRHDWDKHALYLTVGDKVINNENNYDLEFFNGEAGIVVEITELGEIVIDDGIRQVVVPPIQAYLVPNGKDKSTGEDRFKQVTFNPQKNLSLAYALTTHKCQGSEFQHIVYALNKASIGIQCRPNFYTAVTRARKHVTVISDQKSLYTSTISERSWIETQKGKNRD